MLIVLALVSPDPPIYIHITCRQLLIEQTCSFENKQSYWKFAIDATSASDHWSLIRVWCWRVVCWQVALVRGLLQCVICDARYRPFSPFDFVCSCPHLMRSFVNEVTCIALQVYVGPYLMYPELTATDTRRDTACLWFALYLASSGQGSWWPTISQWLRLEAQSVAGVQVSGTKTCENGPFASGLRLSNIVRRTRLQSFVSRISARCFLHTLAVVIFGFLISSANGLKQTQISKRQSVTSNDLPQIVHILVVGASVQQPPRVICSIGRSVGCICLVASCRCAQRRTRSPESLGQCHQPCFLVSSSNHLPRSSAPCNVPTRRLSCSHFSVIHSAVTHSAHFVAS